MTFNLWVAIVYIMFLFVSYISVLFYFELLCLLSKCSGGGVFSSECLDLIFLNTLTSTVAQQELSILIPLDSNMLKSSVSSIV